MNLRRATAAVIGLLLLLAPITAGGNPIRINSPSTITTDGGSTMRLPPGTFVPRPDWLVLDLELKRLQDAETKLTAENKSLRKKPGLWAWVKASFALSVGIVLGRYALGR